MFIRYSRSSFVLAALLTCLLAVACASPPQNDEPQLVPAPTQTIKSTFEPTPAPTSTLSPAPTQVVPPPTQALMSVVELTPSPASSPGSEPPALRDANADVEFVRAVGNDADKWTFHVTVRHPDTGWEDYADGWDVVLPDGMVVKPDPDSPFTRLLTHPHETEQPFTRSQGGIVIPPEVTLVTVRAHDLVDGWGGREVVVDLNAASGPDYEVQR